MCEYLDGKKDEKFLCNVYVTWENDKGQLISKENFGVFNSSKKINLKI